ncbi:MAG: hypothetical protein ACK518_00065 [bacterium]
MADAVTSPNTDEDAQKPYLHSADFFTLDASNAVLQMSNTLLNLDLMHDSFFFYLSIKIYINIRNGKVRQQSIE